MATERRIHHAYFEDQELEALERFEEREQLEFELSDVALSIWDSIIIKWTYKVYIAYLINKMFKQSISIL